MPRDLGDRLKLLGYPWRCTGLKPADTADLDARYIDQALKMAVTDATLGHPKLKFADFFAHTSRVQQRHTAHQWEHAHYTQA